ncbi:hypothetical protein EXIGLDRAFT_678211, partial [Exidia glandulosa HHB12029]
MAAEAKIWKVYAREAKKYDDDMIRAWNASLDTLLIFAGLFSAVSTAFIIESYKLMQPDFAQLTFLAMVGKADISDLEDFEVLMTARAVNCLWISSLIASLTAALISILAKQWLTSYPVNDDDTPRGWAQMRQFRYDSLQAWHVPQIIASLPVFLHVSLLLFLAGLGVFLVPVDITTG